ncbi:pentapeptide repeat-containing protein [Caballeronia mineralivorans]|uniref:pentapeptide repeat-containing protein n=1 Tax=Caballeronia mineralivorans TaxID=2010198 RepID=UPI00069F89B3|nr:pentapeptide repeat-containing protein [Caballeronia mineralivorans]
MLASRLIKATNETAKALRPQFVGFLLLLAYVSVVVASTTDLQLLFDDGTKLPLVDTTVPLDGFFVFAPLLVLVYHFQILVQLAILARSATRFVRSLRRADSSEQQAKHEADSFMLSYSIAGPEIGVFNALLTVPLILTLIVAPPVLLAWIQAAFLPYQSEAITWWHRAMLVCDLCLVVYFVPKTFLMYGAPKVQPVKQRRRAATVHTRRLNAFLFALCLPLVAFSFFAALIPDEPLEQRSLNAAATLSLGRYIPHELPLTHLLFFPLGAESRRLSADNCVDAQEHRLFHRSLDLCRRLLVRSPITPDVVSGVLSYDPEMLRKIEPVTFVRRNFRYANFFAARLPMANLSESDLHGATFAFADLRYGVLSGADMRNVGFQHANLIGATLDGGEHKSGDLSEADFGNALLTCARFDGDSPATGADFSDAAAAGASFVGRDLSSTNFKRAKLIAADFEAVTFSNTTRFDNADVAFADIRPLSPKLPSSLQTSSENQDAMGAENHIAYTENTQTLKRTLDFQPNGTKYLSDCVKKLSSFRVLLYPSTQNN